MCARLLNSRCSPKDDKKRSPTNIVTAPRYSNAPHGDGFVSHDPFAGRQAGMHVCEPEHNSISFYSTSMHPRMRGTRKKIDASMPPRFKRERVLCSITICVPAQPQILLWTLFFPNSSFKTHLIQFPPPPPPKTLATSLHFSWQFKETCITSGSSVLLSLQNRLILVQILNKQKRAGYPAIAEVHAHDAHQPIS
jgi:hypothetical protein